MRIILVDNSGKGSRNFSLVGWRKFVAAACVVGIPVTLGVSAGYVLGRVDSGDAVSLRTVLEWQAGLDEQAKTLAEIKQQSAGELEAYTRRMAEFETRLVRLDALGERVAKKSGVDAGEFDFTAEPGMGGINSEIPVQSSYQDIGFMRLMEQLGSRIDSNQQQLEKLEEILTDREFANTVFNIGMPVTTGYEASPYGYRIDPITGKHAFHAGLDFASKAGSPVLAVAPGVVTWSNWHEFSDYGMTVEIDHGNGYITRYAHNKSNIVKVGDIVSAGQVIALVGHTGRSTGAHLHFEIYKNGRVVDPSIYLHRASR